MSSAPPNAGAGGAYAAVPPPTVTPVPIPATAGSAAGTSTVAAPAAPAAQAPLTNQNLNQIVTDYLLKRGFTKTETVFRQESRNIGADGRPVHTKAMDLGPKKYLKAFGLLKDWVENNLEIYKFELSKLLWPMFVYSWIELVQQNYIEDAKQFLSTLRPQFEPIHTDDLKTFATISLPQHARENPTVKLYLESKYRIPLNQHVAGDLVHFMESQADAGGIILRHILESFCHVAIIERGPIDTFSFEAIHRRARNMDLDEADLQEGIPGVFVGLSNRHILDTSTPLKLGPLPMEPDLKEDVRMELADEDHKRPPKDGRPSLVDEFERKIKREESADTPSRTDIPLPQSRARDVVMEMQRVREYRDRFRIEGRTGGVGGVPVSVCMFTFHNTLGSVSCMDFSNDHELVAAGTTDSYIRVWSLDGKPLRSSLANEANLKINNRKLIGHSGPVYSVAFSDSISTGGESRPFADEGKANNPLQTNSKLLLSCSADGTVRLWSLEIWQCLCIYRGHEGPIFRALWSPHGHYFATGGWDKCVRIWMQDHASPQRLLVGHDASISALAWHPNGIYVFSASDETDKSIRMWSIVTGTCVRIFTGHTDYISTLECAPNGKVLASADNSGNIMLWDIAEGTRIKRSRGHGKGGIWSLSFSVESNVLVSGGQDGTVRLWDVELPAEGHKITAQQQQQQQQQQAPGNGVLENGDGNSAAGGSSGARGVVGDAARDVVSATTTTGPGSKKKGKEVMITPDQISAFATKKTPIIKVQFTRMNLVISGGCYDPDR